MCDEFEATRPNLRTVWVREERSLGNVYDEGDRPHRGGGTGSLKRSDSEGDSSEEEGILMILNPGGENKKEDYGTRKRRV